MVTVTLPSYANLIYMKENIYYVYKHFIKETNEVFYVGRGKNTRAYDRTGRNLYWKRIVNKYGYEVEIVRDDLGLEESKILEIELIARFKPRANLTKGGDGTAGYKFDPDFVKERNQKNKNLWNDPEWVKWRNGELIKAMNRPEVKTNISEGLSKYHEIRKAEGRPTPWAGRHVSEEEKKRLSESQKGEKGYWYGKTNALAKKIIDLDTGEIFTSIKMAAKSVGGRRERLSISLKEGRKTYKKHRFRYYEE